VAVIGPWTAASGTIGRAVSTLPPSPPAYDPQEYWTSLHREESLRAVGQSGLPADLNVWLYRIGRRNVRAFMRRHGLADLTGLSALDIGSGTGFWIDVWRSMGASSIDGVELVPAAVERLREHFPGSTFTLGDIADHGVLPDDRRFDVVAVMNVLLHIVDDDRFAAAAANVAATVRPGGRLLLAEPALVRTGSVRPSKPGESSKARPIGTYRAAFEAGGLRLVAVGPSTVVGANPIETGDPRYRWYAGAWKRIGRWARRWPRLAGLIGLGLAVVDRVLMATGAAPSGKLILFERPASPADTP
jgi:2-polyprenyl-3-methyl-5-hydroxy-6-metoxy-1,4-benzoquinol methylase